MTMLDLPDGTVLFTDTDYQLYVYSPGGTPLAAGKPVITSLTTNGDGSYHLTGLRFNGLSEGAAYGDDAQMDSNYPLVRLTNIVSGAVYYARTYNWNSTSVMTGNRMVSTEFVPPAGLPAGSYNLVVVANGFASDPVLFPPILQNGGFESGNFRGWTLTGNNFFTTVVSNNSPADVHSGIYGVQTGPYSVLGMGYLSQNLNTVPGQSYLLSFWYSNLQTGNSSSIQQIQAAWNGAVVWSATNPPSVVWSNVTLAVTATSTNTPLQFGFINDPYYFGFDDVSVVPLPTTQIQSARLTGGSLAFSWASQSNLNYQVQAATNLMAPVWQNVGGPVTGTGGPITVTNPIVAGPPWLFYRLAAGQ